MNRLEITFEALGHFSFEPLPCVFETDLPAAYWAALALCAWDAHPNPLVCGEIHDVCLRLAHVALR